MRRFQFSLRGLLALTALVAVLFALIPPIYAYLFPTPNVLSDTIVVENGVSWHHLTWSNGVQMSVPVGATAIEARNGSGRWRSPRPVTAE